LKNTPQAGRQEIQAMKHEKFNFKTKEELLHKAQQLGLDLPFSEDIDILFNKIKVAGKTLPNRFAVHPLEGADAEAEGKPDQLTFRRYQRFAQGGSSVIWFEATAVVDKGRSNPRQLLLTRNNKEIFKKLVEETRAAAHKSWGQSHDLLLILQLTHAGRYSNPERKPAPVIAHHHPILDPLLELPENYPLIKDDELDRLQEIFVSATSLAAEAGFDGVDIKACHGYLISELLASFTRRDSKYGGSFENRSRFLLETAKKIKDCLPKIIVTSRLGVYDSLPYPYGFGVDKKNKEKVDLSEPKDLIKKLIQVGFPLLNISIGNPHYKSHYGRPFDKPIRGNKLPDEHPLEGVSRLLSITAELQQEFPALPLVGTGYSWLRQFFPHVAAAMIQQGKASLVGAGREALAYPDFVRDLAQKGALNLKKICQTCSCCSELLRKGGPAGCVVHDHKIYKSQKYS